MKAENANVDLNYFLGIHGTDNVLTADFEEGAGGSSPSLNHPIEGVTPIANDTWYHAAVTYDGTKWQLFLNGNLENELVVGQPVASSSTQHAGLGVALNSTGNPTGHFDGVLDEVRIWNYARDISEIQADINAGNINRRIRPCCQMGSQRRKRYRCIQFDNSCCRWYYS